MKYLKLIILPWLIIACADSPDTDSMTPAPTIKKNEFLTTDADILANLSKYLGLKAIEKGGGGRCLFHSLRAQISQDELKSIKPLVPAILHAQIDAYDAISADDQADLLRKIAIAVQRDFLVTKNNKAKPFDALSPVDQAWALEMAKDWHQQFEGDATKTRSWFNTNKGHSAGRELMWQYVIAHRDAYWAQTGCVTNWAGSAEAIVFARLLNRPLKMYGMDVATTSDGALIGDDGVVLPYLQYDFGFNGAPLLVFQTSGGGHYQMLMKE